MPALRLHLPPFAGLNSPLLPLALLLVLGVPNAAIAAATAAGPGWQKHSVALGESIRGIDVADFDGNGEPDILAVGITQVFAVLNPLKNNSPTVVADLKDGILLYGSSIDVDGDGALDFAIARETNPWISLRTRRAAGAVLADPLGPDFGLAWLRNLKHLRTPPPLAPVMTDLDGIHGLHIADLNRDGRADIVANCIKGEFKDSLVWLENTGAGFTRRFIAKNTADVRPHYLDAKDLNGDNRPDVLVACSGGNTVTWWEHPATPAAPWTKHIITTAEKGATNVYAADFNGDRVLDVVVSNGHGRGLSWFEGPLWRKHVIDADIADTHALALADFNHDGHPDIVTNSFSQKVTKWYANDGQGNFTPHMIDTGSGQESYDIKIADLNGDGRPDFVLAGRATKNAAWYLNLPPAAPK